MGVLLCLFIVVVLEITKLLVADLVENWISIWSRVGVLGSNSSSGCSSSFSDLLMSKSFVRARFNKRYEVKTGTRQMSVMFLIFLAKQGKLLGIRIIRRIEKLAKFKI